MMNPRVFAFFAVLVLVFAVTTGASAAGAGAVSFTTHDHNLTTTTTDVNPCSGATGTLTTTVNDVFHITTLANGTFWATGTVEGKFTFVPFDSSQPSYTGHFTVWFGDNNNLKNGSETSTFSVHGVGSDGSTINFHDVAHLSVSATGVTVAFDKATCR
jgi:hypothetical protein